MERPRTVNEKSDFKAKEFLTLTGKTNFPPKRSIFCPKKITPRKNYFLQNILLPAKKFLIHTQKIINFSDEKIFHPRLKNPIFYANKKICRNKKITYTYTKKLKRLIFRCVLNTTLLFSCVGKA